ncbi:MAG: hypothetical protein MHM6MM_003357 [Cercozoa sp. M6MM]
MGNRSSKLLSVEEAQQRLTTEEWDRWNDSFDRLAQRTARALYARVDVSSSKPFVSEAVFQAAILRRRMPAQMGRRLFDALNVKRNRRLSRREFLTGMVALTRGTVDERLRLLFGMYDTHMDGVLYVDQVMTVTSYFASALSTRHVPRDCGRILFRAMQPGEVEAQRPRHKLSFENFRQWALRHLDFPIVSWVFALDSPEALERATQEAVQRRQEVAALAREAEDMRKDGDERRELPEWTDAQKKAVRLARRDRATRALMKTTVAKPAGDKEKDESVEEEVAADANVLVSPTSSDNSSNFRVRPRGGSVASLTHFDEKELTDLERQFHRMRERASERRFLESRLTPTAEESESESDNNDEAELTDTVDVSTPAVQQDKDKDKKDEDEDEEDKDVSDESDSMRRSRVFVNHSTLEQMLRSGDSAGDDVLVRRVVSAFDANADGRVDLREFLVGLSSCCRGSHDEKLRFAFRVFDANASGHLQRGELEEMLLAVWKVAELKEKIGELLNRPKDNAAADTGDGDGENPDAVHRLVVKLVDTIFRDYDLDGDGRINESEFRRWANDNPYALSFFSKIHEFATVRLGLQPKSPSHEGEIIRRFLAQCPYATHESPASTPLPESSSSAAVELEPIGGGDEESDGVFVVSSRWWRVWRDYVNSDGASVRPGPVDNEDILELEGDTQSDRRQLQLRRSCVEGPDADFVIASERVWFALSNWYGTSRIGAIRRHVVRDVDAPDSRQRVVELFPPAFVVEIPSLGRSIRWYASRTMRIADLKRGVCEAADLQPHKVRMWDAAQSAEDAEEPSESMAASVDAGPAPEPVADAAAANGAADQQGQGQGQEAAVGASNLTPLVDEQTIDEAALVDGQRVLVEIQREDGSWPGVKPPPRASRGFALRRWWPASPASSTTTSAASAPAPQRETELTDDAYKGVTGFYNLGNTCFMNAALQCLNHTPLLSAYFLSKLYQHELNPDNPLGMEAKVAAQYGRLIQQIWHAEPFARMAPRALKSTIGKFAPQFTGFRQQDAQELLAFLLDGLHEGLNRVLDKPYMTIPDSDGRPDAEVAAEHWQCHVARNRSVIVDLFQAQLKSTVIRECDCRRENVKFDPFSVLSLPLPKPRERYVQIVVVFDALESAGRVPVRYAVPVQYGERVSEVRERLAEMCEVPARRLVVAEVFNRRLYRALRTGSDAAVLSERRGDLLYAFEVPRSMAPRKPSLPPSRSKQQQQEKQQPKQQSKQADDKVVVNGKEVTPVDTAPAAETAETAQTVETVEVTETAAESTAEVTEGTDTTEADEKQQQEEEQSEEKEEEEKEEEKEEEEKQEEEEDNEDFAVVPQRDPTERMSSAERAFAAYGPSAAATGAASAVSSSSTGTAPARTSASPYRSPYSYGGYGARKADPQRDVLRVYGDVALDYRCVRVQLLHRRMVPTQDAFLNTHRPKLVAHAPLILWVRPAELTRAQLYDLVWQYCRRYTSMPASTSASSETAPPFTLKRVTQSAQQCLVCPWVNWCFGCALPADDLCLATEPTFARAAARVRTGALQAPTLAIDWDDDYFEQHFDVRECDAVWPHASVSAAANERRRALSFGDCMREFTKIERLEGESALYCGRCERDVPVTKQLELWSLPPVLCIHLKRLVGRGQKIATLVDTPLTDFDPCEFVSPNNHALHESRPRYDLYAVVNHLGSGFGGHYTAHCLVRKHAVARMLMRHERRMDELEGRATSEDKDAEATEEAGNADTTVPEDAESSSSQEGQTQDGHDGEWFLFDDSRVRRIPRDRVVTSRAYMLFYVRRGLCLADVLTDAVLERTGAELDAAQRELVSAAASATCGRPRCAFM